MDETTTELNFLVKIERTETIRVRHDEIEEGIFHAECDSPTGPQIIIVGALSVNEAFDNAVKELTKRGFDAYELVGQWDGDQSPRNPLIS